MLRPGRPVETVPVRRVRSGEAEEGSDPVTVEEPMEIRVRHMEEGRSVTRSVAVTMRTPGEDFELAAGFLFTEGLVGRREEIGELAYCRDAGEQEYNVVTVRLRSFARFDPSLLNRNFYMTSSCGVCGKASLEAVEVKGCAPLPRGELTLDPALVPSLPERLREAQDVFRRTGGIHAAGLFDAAGELRGLMEDVGRHNAVDKAVGAAFLEGRLPLAERILVVSGRASFEILQKALAAGIPAVVAVGAPSSLAVDLARRFRMTLLGFARDGGFNVYAGEERLSG